MDSFGKEKTSCTVARIGGKLTIIPHNNVVAVLQELLKQNSSSPKIQYF